MYLTIKWVGAGYLIYLGLKMIFSAHATDVSQKDESAKGSGHHLFWQGLVTQLANPKAIVYFTALLPQFVTVEGSVPQQFLILGLASILIEFPVLLMYGWLSATSRRLLGRRFHLAWLDKIAGTFLIGAGLKLALSRRT
jgi:threonine/homoserine/homoserine lactone efflux protein